MNGWQRLFLGPLAAFGAFLAVGGVVLAQTSPPLELMDEGNRRYERGEYAEAAQAYEDLINQGYRDTAVYYNLGNTYLESGDLGRAVLSYLRAEELSPRDPGILVNLELARSRTVDQIEAEGDSLVASISDFGRRWTTTGEIGAVALLLWAAGALATGALIVWPAFPRRAALRSGAAVTFPAMLVSLTLLLSMLYSNPYDHTGVVTIRTVEVLGGPGLQYPEEFTLHSGAQVRLVDSRHGWLRVALPGGELQGWAPSHAIEAVGQDSSG